MVGTIINVLAIVVGGLLGKIIGNRIPESTQNTVLNGVGIVVIILGIDMALKAQNIILVFVSLIVGIVIGELLAIEDRLERLGKQVELGAKKIFKRAGNIAEGFVTATLLYVIGPMAIMGALENGLLGTYKILAVKSSLDGISSIILGASLGIGVVFSAIPVLIYQGMISMFASGLETVLKGDVVTEMSALGGLLIIGIGINILGISKIKVANMLPGLLIVIAAKLALG